MNLLVCFPGISWHGLACALNDFCLEAEAKLVLSKCVLGAKCVCVHIQGGHRSTASELLPATSMKTKAGKLE